MHVLGPPTAFVPLLSYPLPSMRGVFLCPTTSISRGSRRPPPSFPLARSLSLETNLHHPYPSLLSRRGSMPVRRFAASRAAGGCRIRRGKLHCSLFLHRQPPDATTGEFLLRPAVILAGTDNYFCWDPALVMLFCCNRRWILLRPKTIFARTDDELCWSQRPPLVVELQPSA